MPQFGEARYQRAALRYASGDLEGARADAAWVFASERSDTLTWSETERQHELIGQVAWAEQLAAWAEAPGWSSARVQGFLGDALRLNGRATEAITAYTRALAATPTDAELLLRRALDYQAADAADAAQADLQRALDARPTPYVRQCALALLATLNAPGAGRTGEYPTLAPSAAVEQDLIV